MPPHLIDWSSKLFFFFHGCVFVTQFIGLAPEDAILYHIIRLLGRGPILSQPFQQFLCVRLEYLKMGGTCGLILSAPSLPLLTVADHEPELTRQVPLCVSVSPCLCHCYRRNVDGKCYTADYACM